MIWLILTGLAVWDALLLACWPVAALVLVGGSAAVIGACRWLHTWLEREARRCAR